MGERRSSYPDRVLVGDGRKRQRWLPTNERAQQQQHFLLSSAAVSISTFEVSQMSEDDAHDALAAIRFAENDGTPFCPHCKVSDGKHAKVYDLTIQRRTKHGRKPTRLYKCSACRRQFSVTSGTALAHHKMPIKKMLCAISLVVNAVSGIAPLRLRREIGCAYATAFVLCGKIATVLKAARDGRTLQGEVEVDGSNFPEHHRQATLGKDRKNRTRKSFSRDNQLVVVAARERGPNGRSIVHVVPVTESRGSHFVLEHVRRDAVLITDEGNWLGFDIHEHRTVCHDDGLLIDGVNTNAVESLFTRLKHGAKGVHHRIRGKNLDLFAELTSWREDHRHYSNGEQWRMVLHALTHIPPSDRWRGYWQRWRKPGVKRRNRRKWLKSEPMLAIAAE